MPPSSAGNQPTDNDPDTPSRWEAMRAALISTATRYWQIPGPDDIEAIRKRSELQLKELGKTRDGLRLWRTLLLVIAFAIPLVGLLTFPWIGDSLARLLTVISCGYLELFALIAFLTARARLQDVKAELQAADYDAYLLSLGERTERSAANLFFKHQLELKRYYDLTLRQHRQAFVLGVVCVLFGLGVVSGAAALVATKTLHSTSAQVVTGSLGAVGALLTGFVARVYLGIYQGSAGALGAFHHRLVETNHLHFANLLLSGVPEPKHAEAMTELALKIPTIHDDPA